MQVLKRVIKAGNLGSRTELEGGLLIIEEIANHIVI